MTVVAALRGIVGDDGVLDSKELAERPIGHGRSEPMQAAALVRPRNTDEVAQVVRWCAANAVPIVTHGGLSGLVRGGDAAPQSVILSTERMRAIESVDARQRTATVQAGVPLEALQQAAEANDLFFALDLGARGSATIGGNASTNAGGNRVIRYGMARDMILGLEVVLADGTVVNSLNPLIKNNTGYDLKQLFIGAEGTLGIITRLVLRLRERPLASQVAMVAAPSFDAVVGLLKHMDRALGGTLSAFEVMWPGFYRLVTTPPAQGRPPIAQDHAFYVLIESLGADQIADGERFGAAMEAAMEAGLLVDAAIAQSQAEAAAIWALRDDVAQFRRDARPVVFDISLPIDAMEAYIDRLGQALDAQIGQNTLWVFGHLGDGNLHLVVRVDPNQYELAKPAIEALVYSSLKTVRGSVSAEHGIGLEKKAFLFMSRTPEELALMRTIKRALDPQNLFNPGKIFDL